MAPTLPGSSLVNTLLPPSSLPASPRGTDMIRSHGASGRRPFWDNPDLSFPGRCPGFITKPPSGCASDESAGLGFISNSNCLLFSSSLGLLKGPEAGPGGSGFQRGRQPPWEPEPRMESPRWAPQQSRHATLRFSWPHPSPGRTQAPRNRWPSQLSSCL